MNLWIKFWTSSVGFSYAMSALQTYRRILTWICICPDGEPTKWSRPAHIAFTTFAIMSLVIGAMSSFAYFIAFLSVSTEDALYALCQIACSSIFIYIMFVAQFSKRNINEIFVNLSKIYDSRKILKKTGINLIDWTICMNWIKFQIQIPIHLHF